MDIGQRSLEKHYEWRGKLEITPRLHVAGREELSLAYTPGVAQPCLAIAADPSQSFALTRRHNLVAVITDGSAVLGLGDIGPEAGMPVMEGKCVLFKEFAGVDAFPLCLKTHDVDELVRAILQDEPMKMYRLAEIFHIDIAAIHEMWILDSGQTKEATAYKEQLAWVKEYLSGFKGTFVADIYGERLLLFLSTPPSLQEAEQMLMDILKGVAQQDANATLTRCSQLMTTGDVRAAYQTYKEHLGDARKIFPLQRIFTGGDMEFVSHCRQLIQKDEAGVKQCLAPLAYLQKDDDEMNLQKTLAVFLLDGASSVTKTAQLLYLHKNTVKYRIKRIADLLGYHPGKMPEAAALYQAVAVQRLLN